MKKYIPNILTGLRGLLTLVIIVLFYVETPSKFTVILGLFLLASFTDYLDGMFARRWKVESVFGKVFDSLFDKILVLSLFMLLIPYDIIPTFIFVILLFRELLVDGLKNFLLSQGSPVSPKISAKIKFWFQAIMIISILLYLIYPENSLIYKSVLINTGLALFFAYYSAVLYMKDFYIALKK